MKCYHQNKFMLLHCDSKDWKMTSFLKKPLYCKFGNRWLTFYKNFAEDCCKGMTLLLSIKSYRSIISIKWVVLLCYKLDLLRTLWFIATRNVHCYQECVNVHELPWDKFVITECKVNSFTRFWITYFFHCNWYPFCTLIISQFE